MTEKDIKELDAFMAKYAHLKTLIKRRDKMTQEIEKLSAEVADRIGIAQRDVRPS